MHPHFDHRWAVSTTNWHAHTGSCTTWYIKSSNLVILHRNLSACYTIDTKYLGITYDETKAVEISEQQFLTCHQANGQFCSINAPLQPLANSPSYAKDKMGIEKRCSQQIRNMNTATIPMPKAPNLQILTSAPKSALTSVMLICPDEAPNFIKT